MSTREPIAPETRTDSAPEAPPPGQAPNPPETNGLAGSGLGHTTHASSEPNPAFSEASNVKRAEELVDRIAVQVSGFTANWGRRVVRVLSRVKEEAEDIWGEAQSIRRGDQP